MVSGPRPGGCQSVQRLDSYHGGQRAPAAFRRGDGPGNGTPGRLSEPSREDRGRIGISGCCGVAGLCSQMISIGEKSRRLLSFPGVNAWASEEWFAPNLKSSNRFPEIHLALLLS